MLLLPVKGLSLGCMLNSLQQAHTVGRPRRTNTRSVAVAFINGYVQWDLTKKTKETPTPSRLICGLSSLQSSLPSNASCVLLCEGVDVSEYSSWHYVMFLSVGVLASWQNSYLVDPASSHMLVSKIKPCMSKYKQLYTVKLRTAHYISNNLFDGSLLHG